MSHLGIRLNQLRNQRSLSQAELAAVIGVHQTHISAIERGDKLPSWSVVQSLATYFGVSTEEFRFLNDEPTQEPIHA